MYKFSFFFSFFSLCCLNILVNLLPDTHPFFFFNLSSVLFFSSFLISVKFSGVISLVCHLLGS